MTVRELIDVLRQQNPDALVLTNDSEYSGLYNIKLEAKKVFRSEQADKYIGPYDDDLDSRTSEQIIDAVIIDIKEV